MKKADHDQAALESERFKQFKNYLTDVERKKRKDDEKFMSDAENAYKHAV